MPQSSIPPASGEPNGGYQDDTELRWYRCADASRSREEDSASDKDDDDASDYDPFNLSWRDQMTMRRTRSGRRYNWRGKALNSSRGTREKRSLMRPIMVMIKQAEENKRKVVEGGMDEDTVKMWDATITELRRRLADLKGSTLADLKRRCAS